MRRGDPGPELWEMYFSEGFDVKANRELRRTVGLLIADPDNIPFLPGLGVCWKTLGKVNEIDE